MRASEPSTSGARAGGPGGKSTSLSPPYPRCSTGGSRNLGAPTGTGRAGGWVVQVAGRPRLRGLARSPVFTAEKAASREQPRHGNERQGWGRLRGKQENDAGKGGNLQAHLSRLAQMSSRAVERCGVRTARISDPQRGSPAPRHPARGRSECEGQRAEGRRWGGGAPGGPGSHFGARVHIGRLLRAHQLLWVFTWLLPIPSGAVRVVASGGR